jgi:AraC-like DNA-binding protein
MTLYDIATADLAWAGPAPRRTQRVEGGLREETTHFANELAQGSYHDIYLPDLHIGYGDLRPARPLRLRSQRAAPVLEMHFLLEGACLSRLTEPGPELWFRAGESNLLFLPGPLASRHEVPAGQTCREFEVHLSGSYFQRLAHAASGPPAGLGACLQGAEPVLLHQSHRPISTAMRSVMHQIMTCALGGPARIFWLEAKVLELLALQVAPVEAPALPAGPRLRNADIERLHAARALLLQDLSQPPTLPQLAALSGLNECKLKQGFRALFGDTVYGCLLHCKLEKAHHCLQQGQMTVAEVADAVGYRHASHFTAAFKKKYGMLPKEVWRQLAAETRVKGISA